ncbi:hypothetical protein SAMN05216262_108142 [Colwellia chukchiensis]|uniref:Outer membrane protein beta-barrel domain-containing protein n=1 Tax=Colwellia chukchiensis TaxID=641665 RepID=A0A1H7NZG8_9GAMM|nr:hypothetical protein [Colwellia chukchiensis]SEL29020.1 hypothetical protein SAMN05216262_108142 [Colwellia chukchiensis]
MRLILLAASFISPLLSAKSLDESKLNFGVGIGQMYNGLGGNVALTDLDSLKFIAIGCTGDSSTLGTICGASAGWITTTLFESSSNKHGLGLYLSNVDKEIQSKRNNDGSIYFTEKEVYGFGVSYTYFINGINKRGFNIGTSIHYTNSDLDNVGYFLQAGYQF